MSEAPTVAPPRAKEDAPASGARGLGDWRRLLPLALVSGAVLFNLVVLRHQLIPAQNLNDGAVHEQMIRWAALQWSEGHLPLDGWYPYLQMGSSRFHHYQSLPHVLTGLGATAIPEPTLYRWVLYLLLATWPVSVYLGGRLLGWGRWSAGAAALVSPLVVSTPSLGYEHGSYVWQGWGVWGQLWAMWTLPLAWGFSWRAVARGKGYAGAALVGAVTIAFHFIAGYLALLAIGVWVLAARGPWLRKVARGAVTAAGSVLAASWVIVPLVADARWTNRSIYLEDTIYRDSFGATRVLGWLFTGRLFDRGQAVGRFPILSLLVAVGVAVCVARLRRDDRARGLLGIWVVSVLLFCGRPTLGAVLDLLPGIGDAFLRRFIVGVHLGGVLLAGVGAGWLGARAVEGLRRLRPGLSPALATSGVMVLTAAALLPAWLERAAYQSRAAEMIEIQRRADLTDGADAAALIDTAVGRGDGRVFAGMRGRAGDDYRIGFVPMYAGAANRDADALGFTLRTPSLSADVETLFSESNPAHYDLFNIRYVILPEDQEPPVPASLLEERGRHALWEVETSGYLEVVDTITPITARRDNLAVQVDQWMRSGLVGRHRHPTIGFEGGEPALPTSPPGVIPEDPPGRVVSQDASPADGFFVGVVEAERTSVVLLKATFDPRWEVVVDGHPAAAQMVSPSFVGVEVPPGRHSVEFRYVPVGYYEWLLALGALTAGGLAAGPRVLPGLRRPARGRARGSLR